MQPELRYLSLFLATCKGQRGIDPTHLREDSEPCPQPQMLGIEGGYKALGGNGSPCWAQPKVRPVALSVLMLQKRPGLTPGLRSHCSTPVAGLPFGAQHPRHVPQGSAAWPLSGLPMTVSAVSSPPPCPVSAFSLFTRCSLRCCIFSYNIMSDPDFPKSTL